MLHFGDITWQPGSALRIDPFHGWCARKSMDSVTEMEVRSRGDGFSTGRMLVVTTTGVAGVALEPCI